jgi:cytochrome b involved in lipid metabolism
MGAKESVFSYCEIRKENNCGKTNYIVANGKIYDVTTLLNNHPGGDNVLMDAISTLDDQSKNLSMHNNNLQQKIERLKIGSVCKCSKYCLLCTVICK